MFAARKTDVVFLAAVVFVPFYAPRTLHPPLSACSRKHCISIIPVPAAGRMACRGQNSGFLRRGGCRSCTCQPHPPSPTRSHKTENGGAGPSLYGGAARGIMEMQCLRLQADRNGRGVCGWKTGKRLPQPVINRPFYKPQTPRPFLSECGVSTHSIIPPPRRRTGRDRLRRFRPSHKIIQKEYKKIHFFFDRIFYYKGTSFMNETKRCISKSKNHIQTDKT